MVEIPRPALSVLRELCMDSRKSVNEIAESGKLTRGTVRSRIRGLEKNYGLKYVPEFDLAKLGLIFSYAVKVKLKRAVARERLEEALEGSPAVQFAALTKGDFDLFVFVTASDHQEFIRWQKQFRAEFAGEIGEWETLHVIFNRLGFFPINEETVARASIPEQQKKVLLELNRNARATFTEIARKTGLTLAVVRYQFKQILKEGYAKRFTLVLEKPPPGINLVVFASYSIQKDHEKRSAKSRAILKADSGLELTNTWALVSEVSGTADTLRLGSFEDLKSAYGELEKIDAAYGGPEFISNKSGIVVEVLKGIWPARNVDPGVCYDATSWEAEE